MPISVSKQRYGRGRKKFQGRTQRSSQNVVHGINCPTSRNFPWPGLFFNSIQPLRHMRTLSCPGQTRHPSPLASGPK